MEPDVLVIGSLHLDIVVSAQALPMLDETARGSSWKMVCGGKGGNQAVWAARCGAKTQMISRVGDDDFGRRLLANLDQAGVDRSAVSIDPELGSGMSVAIVQKDGNYGAVIVSGSNLALDERQVLEKIGFPRVVLLQNEIEEHINIAAARHAKQRGSLVILNAAPARTLGAELARSIDLLVVNRVEAEMLSGSPDMMVAAKKLAQTHCPVVVTLGGNGLLIAEGNKPPFAIAAKSVNVVSTHGAGDCFLGQLAQSCASGQALTMACEKANETAAAFVSGTLY